MTNYYYLSDGLAVKPEMDSPLMISNLLEHQQAIYEWETHLHSLPTFHVSKEYAAKLKVGDWFVAEEQYQRTVSDLWFNCSKDHYEQTSATYRRIVLVEPAPEQAVGVEEKGETPITRHMKALRYGCDYFNKKNLDDFTDNSTDEEKWLFNELTKAYVQGWEDKTLSPPSGSGEAVEQEKLWDEVEDIFDKHTAPTGGGYEADWTDKSDFINELKSKYIINSKK